MSPAPKPGHIIRYRQAMQAVVDYASAGRQHASLSTDELSARYLAKYHELATSAPFPETFRALEGLQSEMTLRGKDTPALPQADLEAVRNATIAQHRQIDTDPLARLFRILKMQDTIDKAEPPSGLRPS